MLLTQDQEMIRDAVRAYAQEQLWPHAAQWDKEHTFPKEAHQGLAALGAYGIGGAGGLGTGCSRCRCWCRSLCLAECHACKGTGAESQQAVKGTVGV
jgi:alkylation response protein AidB-like acyl-CoA dehydrogenase